MQLGAASILISLVLPRELIRFNGFGILVFTR